MDCLVPVEAREGDPLSQSRTTDISRGGMGVFSRVEIPVGQEITIELDLQDKGEPVFVIGRVQWVREEKNGQGFRMGMSFVDILYGSKERLRDFFS